MKGKKHFTTTILLVLAVFITLGCQIASQAASTPEAETSSVTINSPTQAPTNTQPPPPTSTQPPKLDISTAVLTLDDLPPGFEEFNPDELEIFADDFNDGELQPEDVFIFMNSEDFQMVFGFNFLLAKNFDRAAFDVGISKPELTLPALIDGMGSENVQGEKILEGFEDIGDKQIGMTMIADMDGMPFQVDVLMFRRDVVGAMVMSMVLEGDSPNISLHELGLKLDEHMQAIK